jgi:DNA-binding NarL/FixJ family response regulator
MSLMWTHRAKPTVFLFEPHPLTIGYLRAALKKARPVSVLECPATLALCEQDLARSVFVFDRATHGDSIADGLGRLRERFPDAKAVLLDFECRPEDQFHMLLVGFKGVVLYEDVEEKLPAAILSVLSGGYWVDDAVLAQYVQERPRKPAARDAQDGLTQREIEVAELLKRKLSNKEISVSLAVSEGTVKFHIANIFSKLGVRDRWSAVELLDKRLGGRAFVVSAGTPNGMMRPGMRAS